MWRAGGPVAESAGRVSGGDSLARAVEARGVVVKM